MPQIRKLTLADARAADAILTAAFPAMSPAGIVSRELALAPETCWLAIDDENQPAGMACAIQYGHAAYIGPMAVHPESQGKGIGQALMHKLIESLEARTTRTMLLDATTAGEPLYRKFGFVESSETLDLSRPPGHGIFEAPSSSDWNQALTLDHVVFGANREPMFRRLTTQEGAVLFTNPSGYLIAQTKVLGPFAATRPEAAAKLLDDALNAGAPASRVLTPIENPHARNLLLDRGFVLDRVVKQMRRGEPLIQYRELIYGLASFALG